MRSLLKRLQQEGATLHVRQIPGGPLDARLVDADGYVWRDIDALAVVGMTQADRVRLARTEGDGTRVYVYDAPAAPVASWSAGEEAAREASQERATAHVRLLGQKRRADAAARRREAGLTVTLPPMGEWVPRVRVQEQARVSYQVAKDWADRHGWTTDVVKLPGQGGRALGLFLVDDALVVGLEAEGLAVEFAEAAPPPAPEPPPAPAAAEPPAPTVELNTLGTRLSQRALAELLDVPLADVVGWCASESWECRALYADEPDGPQSVRITEAVVATLVRAGFLVRVASAATP